MKRIGRSFLLVAAPVCVGVVKIGAGVPQLTDCQRWLTKSIGMPHDTTNTSGQPANLRLANLNGNASSGASIGFQELNAAIKGQNYSDDPELVAIDATIQARIEAKTEKVRSEFDAKLKAIQEQMKKQLESEDK